MEKFYNWLEKIKSCPEMWLGRKSLELLKANTSGYLQCACEYGVKTNFFENFQIYVEKYFYNKGYGELGWDGIILKECNNDEDLAFEKFYEILEEYKRRDVRYDSDFLVVGNPKNKIHHDFTPTKLCYDEFGDERNGFYSSSQIGYYLCPISEKANSIVFIQSDMQIVIGNYFELFDADDLKAVIGCKSAEMYLMNFDDYVICDNLYLKSKNGLWYVFPIVYSETILAWMAVEANDNTDAEYFIGAIKRLEEFL